MTELYTAEDLSAQIAANNAIVPGSLSNDVVVPLARAGKSTKSGRRTKEMAAEGQVEAAGQVVVLPQAGKEPKKSKGKVAKVPAEPKEPAGKRLDVNSRMRALFADGGWERVKHTEDAATYVLGDKSVTTRLNAVWALTQVDGETLTGKGAKELAAAL